MIATFGKKRFIKPPQTLYNTKAPMQDSYPSNCLDHRRFATLPRCLPGIIAAHPKPACVDISKGGDRGSVS